MGVLDGRIDFVLGIDTHRDSYTAAALDAGGGTRHIATVASDAFGHRKLLAFADEHAKGRRVWAVEGVGSYGAGLTVFLLEHGEQVAEVDRPKRPLRRNGAKSDELDAVRAAREALACDHLAQP